MQAIADWLENLGMSEYAQRFADNGIDVSVLPHLTSCWRIILRRRASPRRRSNGGVTRECCPSRWALME